MSNEGHRLVVGVDCGTTYSVVAYTYLHTKKPEYHEIQVISTWPGKGGDVDNRTLDMVPTELSFETGGNLWGYQIAPGAKRYKCFKLFLDAVTGKTTCDHSSLESAIDSGNPNTWLGLPPGKDVNDIIFEYLSLLYEHIMQQLRKRCQVTFDSTSIQFVLPTPATWSHLAQDAIRRAAERAGFGSRPGDTITMIAEPEAIAYYCLREMAHSARSGSESLLREGQRILICDAGDSTVDLIPYTITQTSPCFKVNEASMGTGALCGSRSIDRAFLEFVKSRVSAPFRKWLSEKTGRGSILMTEFEMVKRGFGASSYDQIWCVPVGNVVDDIENGITEGVLEITSKEMAKIFDPIVGQIIQLVAQQVRVTSAAGGEKVLTIFLVGGFGGSQYLLTKLREWCGSQPFPVDVISPSHLSSATARGAVIHGIQGIAVTRKLRSHYGAVLACPFRRAKHDEEETYFDEFLMKIMTNDNVVWFAKKGEDVGDERRFPLPCFSTFPEWQGKVIGLDLKRCGVDNAPVSPKSDGTSLISAYILKDQVELRDGVWLLEVETVGRIKVDLSSIAESEFELLGVTPRGRIFGAKFTIEMVVRPAEIAFSLIHNGASHGSVPIEYY